MLKKIQLTKQLGKFRFSTLNKIHERDQTFRILLSSPSNKLDDNEFSNAMRSLSKEEKTIHNLDCFNNFVSHFEANMNNLHDFDFRKGVSIFLKNPDLLTPKLREGIKARLDKTYTDRADSVGDYERIKSQLPYSVRFWVKYANVRLGLRRIFGKIIGLSLR